MRLNITMLVRNRPKLTLQALQSLVKNTTSEMNLTIVDDESDDETRILLEAWMQSLYAAHLVRNYRSNGTGAARNQSITESEKTFGRGDFLVLLDNDTYLTRGWDKKLIEAHEIWGETVKVIGGYNHPYLKPNSKGSHNGLTLTTHDAVAGVCWMMTWETYYTWGPFDANALGVRQSEDWAFCQRVIKDGFLVGALDPHVVYHCGRTDSFGEQAPAAELASPLYEGIIIE